MGVHDEKHLASGGRITFREGASIQEDHGRLAQVRGIQKESVDSGRCFDSPKSGFWEKLDAVILGATDSDSNKTLPPLLDACCLRHRDMHGCFFPAWAESLRLPI